MLLPPLLLLLRLHRALPSLHWRKDAQNKSNSTGLNGRPAGRVRAVENFFFTLTAAWLCAYMHALSQPAAASILLLAC